MAEDLEAASSQRDAMRTMLGKLGTLLEQVVGLAFPKPPASEGALRMPGAKLRDRLQEKLRGILFRYTPTSITATLLACSQQFSSMGRA